LDISGNQILGLAAEGGGQNQIIFRTGGYITHVGSDTDNGGFPAYQGQIFFDLFGRQPPTKVRVIQGFTEFLKNRRSYNQFKKALLPGSKKPSWGSGPAEEA
jgi:hypothetical protein